jgi:hypothetical protein
MTQISLGACVNFAGTLSDTPLSPQLSGISFNMVSGFDGLKIVSKGTLTTIYTEWSHGDGDPGNLLRLRDFLTYPHAGYGCEKRYYGQYYLNFGSGCDLIVCTKADSCPVRTGVLQGMRLNGYDGPGCPALPDDAVLEYSNSGCSDGNIWFKSVEDCTSQLDGSTCMYCHGVANGLDVKLCLERNGGGCNDIFRSTQAQGWCNLEFECPASTLSLSVFALFFIFLSLVVM